MRMDWLSLVIEEYRAVMDEKMATMNTQQSILRIGTAIVGALLVAGLNLWDKAVLSEFILLFLVPIVSYLSLVIWMGELRRMVRAKEFLSSLEHSLNAALSHAPVQLSWESWLRQKKDGRYPHILKWNYRAILTIFLLIAAGSIALGLHKISGKISDLYIMAIAGFEIILIVAVVLWYTTVAKSFHKVLSQQITSNFHCSQRGKQGGFTKER